MTENNNLPKNKEIVELAYSTLLNRLLQCNSLYTVAKIYGEAKDPNSPVSRWHSSIDHAIRRPFNSKLETIKNIVEAMGGNIYIHWGELPEILKPLHGTLKSESFRIAQLEQQILELKEMLANNMKEK